MAVQTEISTNNNKPDWNISKLWLIIFSIFTFLGAVCWGMQLSKGLQVTNLGVKNMWGLYITFFMIFTGVSAGSLFFASIPYLFKLEEFKPYCRIATYVGAVSSIVAASLFIIVDIGNPERAWLFITSGNLTSPMFWDFLLLVSYMVISVIFTRQLILVYENKKEEKSVKPIAIVAIVASILVTATSFVFSFQIARPMWNTPAQPLSFLLTAFAGALAVLILLAFILTKNGYIKMQIGLLSKMAKVAATLLFVELIIIVIEVLIGLYPGGGEEHAGFIWLVSGKGAVGFWLEIIALTAAIVLLGNKSTSKKKASLLAGVITTFLSIYLIKSNLLQSELFNPIINLPGFSMYGDSTELYIPSLIEVGISLGIISLGGLLLMFGFRKLNLGMETIKNEYKSAK